MARKGRSFHLEIFLISFAALLLEISYTRIFSFKLYYYFAYFIIGIALLGVGSGAVFVSLYARRIRLSPERLVPIACLAGGVAVGLGYVGIAVIELDTRRLGSDLYEFFALGLLCGLLFLPFLAMGTGIASIFSHRTRSSSTLYCADLVGAGIACAMAIPLLHALTPPGAIFLGGAVLVLAGVPAAGISSRTVGIVNLSLAGLLTAGAIFPEALPGQRPDRRKMMNENNPRHQAVIFTRWNPVFRVDVMDQSPRTRLILHDGRIGSTLHRFDGDLATLSRFDRDSRSYPFQLVRRNPRVLIIGSAGGHEILTALYFRAEHVTGVELNPVTVSLLTEHFAEFTGRLGKNQKITLVVDDGRSFLAGREEKYDLIFFVAPDSYAAMNTASSGAYVLSESYLYTVEMLELALDHLEVGGIICAQFGEVFYGVRPLRTARYAATARAAFESSGQAGFERNILVGTVRGIFTNVTILLRKEEFSASEVEAFLSHTRSIPGAVARYAWGAELDDGAVNQSISLPEERLGKFHAEYPYDITPVMDDSPFFWHFVRFRDALLGSPVRGSKSGIDPGVAQGERVLIYMLVFAVGYAAVFLLLPFVSVRKTFAGLPLKGRAFVYFGCLGVGFMLFEICMMQMLTLLLGYPTYSLTVTLLGLLVSAGIGSFLSRRYLARRNRSLLLLFGALVLLNTFYLAGMPHAINVLVGSSMVIKVAASLTFVAPLGICLGAFLPLGLATVTRLSEFEVEYVAWSWAVNGFFGVVSSVLAAILSMTIGFQAVLVLALVVYAIGSATLSTIPYRVTR